MAEIASTLGLGATWEFRGKKYRVARRVFQHEGLFELWCEQEQLLGIRRSARTCTPAEYEHQMTGYRRDKARHYYRYPSAGCLEMLASLEGSKFMAYLQLAENNPAWGEEEWLAFIEEVFAADPELDPLTNQPRKETPWQLLMEALSDADMSPLPKTAAGPSTPAAPAAAS